MRDAQYEGTRGCGTVRGVHYEGSRGCATVSGVHYEGLRGWPRLEGPIAKVHEVVLVPRVEGE